MHFIKKLRHQSTEAYNVHDVLVETARYWFHFCNTTIFTSCITQWNSNVSNSLQVMIEQTVMYKVPYLKVDSWDNVRGTVLLLQFYQLCCRYWAIDLVRQQKFPFSSFFQVYSASWHFSHIGNIQIIFGFRFSFLIWRDDKKNSATNRQTKALIYC